MIKLENGATDTDKPCVLIENHFATGTIVATSTAGGFAAENVAEENTYDGWKANAVPAPNETLTLTLDASAAADCLAFTAHNLAGSTEGMDLSYWDGAAWQVAATFDPPTNETFMVIFPEQTSDQWRVTFKGPIIPAVNYMMLGKRMVFPTGIVGAYTPTDWSQETEILGGETNSGQFLGQRVLRRSADIGVSIGRVPLDWHLTTGKAFVDHFTDGRPFIYAGWPQGLPDDVGLCWRGERNQPIRPTISDGGYVNISFAARAYVAA